VLPENFAFMGKNELDKLQIQEKFGHGLIQDFLAQQAKQLGIWIIGGTIPIASQDPNKVYAACLVYNDQGQCVARYDKIHLFDVTVTPNTEIYRESNAITPGEKIVVVDTPVGRVGLAVCYDIRFPELFREMLKQDVEIIALPTAFTLKTGQAHWEVLTRARAIENQCYLIAACQTGTHENGRQTYGHSLIIDPWGKILNCLPDTIGTVTADINLLKLQEIRQTFPTIKHIKI
jgi:nitrilase